MRSIITFILLINTCFAQVLITPTGGVLTTPTGNVIERDAYPNEIQGLVAWYKADGTYTLNGSNVSQWNDESGNGWHIAQSTASAQPLYVANAFNGKPAMYFDAGDKLATTLFSAIGTTTGYTVFYVARPLAIPNSNNQLIYEFSNTLGYGGAVHKLNTTNRLYVNTTSISTNLGYVLYSDVTNFYYGAVRFDGTGAANADRLRLYINSVQQTMTFAGTIPAAISYADGLSIGGTYTASTNLFNGYICELFIYNRALSATEVIKMNTYLRQKYAI